MDVTFLFLIIHFMEKIIDTIGIIGAVILLLFLGLIAWYVWFGPGIEVGPTFPRDPQGVFTQPPIISTKRNETNVQWAISVSCSINEIEFQQEGKAIEDSNSWGGGTADCVEEKDEFTCQADLTDRGLLRGVTYHLQAHHYQCTNGAQYVSEVVKFVF